jgi:hypothetical protein
MEQRIIEAAVRRRQPLPDVIANAPEIHMGLEAYYEAFMDLSTSRGVGMALGPIPWTAVDRYAERHGYTGEGFRYLWQMPSATTTPRRTASPTTVDQMAKGDLFDFGRKIRITAHRVQSGADEATVQVATNVVTELAESTPVDTGRAISNWQASVGPRAVSYRTAAVPGKKGSTQQASVSEAIARMVSAISGYRAGKEKSIHISNGAPYIGKLNRGSSTQAPAGFVEKAIQRGRAAIRNVRILK